MVEPYLQYIFINKPLETIFKKALLAAPKRNACCYNAGY